MYGCTCLDVGCCWGGECIYSIGPVSHVAKDPQADIGGAVRRCGLWAVSRH